MKTLLGAFAVLLLIGSNATGRKHKMKTRMLGKTNMFLADDPLLEVEPIPPDTMIGECSCKCCENAPAVLEASPPPCVNDVMVAVDSSACFRDHHGRMMRFLKKLVRKIGRVDDIEYGASKTRLGLMQFSSDIENPIELRSFEDYTNPASAKNLQAEILERVNGLRFLGEGSFLNKALNTTVDNFRNQPRPDPILDDIVPTTPRKVLILMTNGKSHPDVTMEDIDASIAGLAEAGIVVYPISVTRECHGVQTVAWNEGLCPATGILNSLAKVGREEGSSFLEMTSHETTTELINALQKCPDSRPAPIVGPSCNNCTCECELPIGPPGPIGKTGEPGPSVKGEPGKKGEVGPDGPRGLKGEEGEKGDKGDQGEQGDIGPPGIDGIAGIEGEKGDEGEKGVQGQKGESGVDGNHGEDGDRGETGQKGEVGEKGIQGLKGDKGDEGDVGEQGIEGPQGVKGQKGESVKGDEGDDGNEGPVGPKGIKGDLGPEGDKGRQGLCGQPGPGGLPGPDGIPGVDGAEGSRGPQGVQGPRGERGEIGERGENGVPGEQGFPGRDGLRGERGPEGPQGERGFKGEKGEPSDVPGRPGIQGNRGGKGDSGADGSDGTDGAQGVPGVQGPQGQTGPRGPPGELDLNQLRPIIAEIVRELLPAECAPPQEPPNTCQEYPVDVVFLVDGSDSIGREEFVSVKDWILLAVDRFKPGMRSIPLHVDVVQYSERSNIEVHQNVETNISEIEEQVKAIEQMRSGTKTYTAIQFVNDEVVPEMRDGSFKILITMTDGDASDDRNEAAIEDARANFHMMFSVGVGDKVDNEELLDFSSNGHVFNVGDFAALESVIANIVENTCAGIDAILAEASEPVVTTVAPSLPPSRGDSSPGCIDAMTDLAFIIDGSSSVGMNGFSLLKEFLRNVVSGFHNVGNDGTQVAMIQYTDNAHLEFDFSQTTSKQAVLNAIDNLVFRSGNTETGEAIEFAHALYNDIEGSRDSRKVAVVITDGRSQDDVKIPAEELRIAGAKIFAIGVGEAELVELEEIASSPLTDFIFSVDDYTAIATIQEMLVEKICIAARGTYRSDDGETSSIKDEDLLPGGGKEPFPPDDDYFNGGSGEFEFTI